MNTFNILKNFHKQLCFNGVKSVIVNENKYYFLITKVQNQNGKRVEESTSIKAIRAILNDYCF